MLTLATRAAVVQVTHTLTVHYATHRYGAHTNTGKSKLDRLTAPASTDADRTARW
jgi:hypothetical protein